MWSGLTAAAKEGLEDGLSGLERLKKNLQSAAVMCQPSGAAGAVFETELEARCGTPCGVRPLRPMHFVRIRHLRFRLAMHCECAANVALLLNCPVCSCARRPPPVSTRQT